jgi:hypothetical protein
MVTSGIIARPLSPVFNISFGHLWAQRRPRRRLRMGSLLLSG